MRVDRKEPPRAYRVGRAKPIDIKDCGNVVLEADEQVTFTTEKGGEYDVARKSWGFYATPSTNGRLAGFGLRTALVKNGQGRFYIMLVERGHEADFEQYLVDESNRVIAWLDDERALATIEESTR